jgi:hypothetical protein
MPDIIDSNQVDVLVDGGSSDGRLVTSGGKLAAVLVKVTAAEVSDTATEGGWFLEAGFGPCGILKTHQPNVFRSEGDALQWVERQLQSD